MSKRKEVAIATNDISSVTEFVLGGYKQKVLIEGKSLSNPIVVALHGGSGSPLPFGDGARGMFPEFTNDFILVCWDQLGCGANNHVLDDSFSINNFVDMTIDLLKELKNIFPNNSINLLGVSWGSVLAAKTALKVPELIDNIVIAGQVIKNLLKNKDSVSALYNSEMPVKFKLELGEILEKKQFYFKDFQMISTWIRKYTDGYKIKNQEGLSLSQIIRALIGSPDYSLKDIVALFNNGYLKNRSLYEELSSIDLTQDLENVSQPYSIFQGKHDLITPASIIEEFASKTNNKNITLTILEKSAHIPSDDDMKRIVLECKRLMSEGKQ